MRDLQVDPNGALWVATDHHGLFYIDFISIGWYTTFAGNDYRENEERAWSSYCEFSYPFTVKGVDYEIAKQI